MITSLLSELALPLTLPVLVCLCPGRASRSGRGSATETLARLPAVRLSRILQDRLGQVGVSVAEGSCPPFALPVPVGASHTAPANPSKVVSSASAGLAAGADMYVRSRRLETPDSLGVCTSGHADGNKQGSDAYGHDHQSPPDCGRLCSEAHSAADELTGEIVQMDKRTDGKKANVNPDAAFHNQRGRQESLADDDAALAHLHGSKSKGDSTQRHSDCFGPASTRWSGTQRSVCCCSESNGLDWMRRQSCGHSMSTVDGVRRAALPRPLERSGQLSSCKDSGR